MHADQSWQVTPDFEREILPITRPTPYQRYTTHAFTGGQIVKVRVDFGDDDHSHLEDPERHYARHMGRQ